VLYGGNNNWFAAYAYWQFKLYGHATSSCSTAGARSGSSTAASSSRTSRAARDLVRREGPRPVDPRVPRRGRRLDRAEEPRRRPQPRRVQRQDQGAGHLPQEQSQRAGHVPTAINIPWSKAAADDGTFRSDEELAKLYGEQGFDDSRSTIAYCRIGERSSHTWFVLHELLGKTDVKNYDGSWAEYGSLVGVPVQKDV
jgi:thiosulfate/3-mercaptopyruvate sulfurtransferase